MTAVAAPPVPVRARRLGWVTWRQQRLAYLCTAGSLALIAGWLFLTGRQMRHYYSSLGLGSCGPLDGDGCRQPLSIFVQRYETWAQYAPRFLEFVPAILGVFVAAPLVSRELESGTFRFAWTQGRSRTEWIVAKLVWVGAPITVMAVLFSAAFTWWFGPFEPMMGRMAGGQAYEVSGLVFAARTLFALMLGAVIGAVVRRVVVAMALTGAIWVASSWIDIISLRPRIETPIAVPASSSLITSGGWTISTWLQGPTGVHYNVKSGAVAQLYRQAQAAHAGSFEKWLTQHGYVEWVTYQPESRFWHFQLIEVGAYLLVAVLLAAGTMWFVRRRAS